MEHNGNKWSYKMAGILEQARKILENTLYRNGENNCDRLSESQRRHQLKRRAPWKSWKIKKIQKFESQEFMKDRPRMCFKNAED